MSETVLFVITVPTEAEENNMKKEFFNRNIDSYSDQTESNYGGPFSGSKTNDPSGKYTSHSGEDSEETISAMTVEISTPTRSANALNDIQYGTFPKLSKEKTRPKLTIDVTPVIGATKRQSEIDSMRDMDGVMNESAPNRKSWDGLRDIITSSKRKTAKKKDHFNLDIPNDTCMETVVREILKKFNISNAVWTKDNDNRIHQILFTVEFNEVYEQLLEKLFIWGIGERERSAVAVMNCVTSRTFTHKADFDLQDDFKKENMNDQKQGAWNRFMNSVRSRLNVAQIVRDVRQDAAITFDFSVLLVSAAILASFGLVEDSTIFLASSMLISPLMGPIIAAIFGTVIKDPSLRTLGLKNELIGILGATLVGFLFGLVVCTIDERYGIGEGLTTEMLSRCKFHSLLVGVFTAIPSGAAAAIGILGGNIGSLVGVAISASLLPPAVNSGLLWALACIYKFFETDESRYPNVVKTSFYSNNQAAELAILGTISMCLTISNVLCIYLMGIVVLKVKEIAPVISRNNRDFWKHDIKIARGLNKNGIDTDTAIIDEFANLPTEDQKVLGLDCEFLRNIQRDEATYQNTWSPIATRPSFEPIYEHKRENYSTVHRLERLYSTITNQHMWKERKLSMAHRPTGRISEIGTSYRELTQNIPRCSTMPNKVLAPVVKVITPDMTTSSTASTSNQTSETNTPTSTVDERKRRKFIVTPAADPLCYIARQTEYNV